MVSNNNVNIRAMLFMALNAISLASLYATMKFITGSVNSNQATFLYKFIILIFILPWIFYKDGINAIRTPNVKLHLLRSVFSAGGSLSMMYSLKFLKLLDVTALTHLEQMLWIVVGTVFFNERITTTKIVAVLLAFFGGFIIVKPEALHNLISQDKVVAEFNKGYLFIFLTVALWVVNSSLVKLLGNRKATNKAQLFYVMLFASLFSYCVAFVEWKHFAVVSWFFIPYPGGFNAAFDANLGLKEIGLISIASLFYLIHSVAFFQGMKGDMTSIAPLVYLKLVCSGSLGYIIWREVPKMAVSYVGYAMIITAGILVVIAEYRKQKQTKQTEILNAGLNEA